MDQSPNAARKPASRGPTLRSLFWWTFWLLLASSALARLPYEVGYWMLALAEKSSLEGRTEEALSWVEQAKPWLPNDPLPKRVTASIWAHTKTSDPFAQIEELLKGDPSTYRKAELYLRKCVLFQQQGEWEKALEAYDTAADLIGSLRPAPARLELLIQANKQAEAKRELAQIDWKSLGMEASQIENTFAYFSALLNDNLDEALKRVGVALAEKQDEPAYLDTRGYIFYRLGKHDQALVDLERSVELMEKSYGRTNNLEAKKALAVIVYHRSLVLEALEKSAEAERDRTRVKELGFEPNERLF